MKCFALTGKRRAAAVISIAGVMGLQNCSAQKPVSSDLSSMSLEQLTQLDVSTVSRREQKLFATPAAVYVITRDQILQSGATSVPEVLRMVPGLEVAQIDANKWAVSARGFNSRFANKMLIMIDNRSIYNPVYSGTLWDQNDLPLDSIERIEVVRGPGGTMWGANAVNGVINIVTLRARDTRGLSLKSDGGRMDQGASLRFGSSHGHNLDYRVSLKAVHRSALLASDGSSAHDAGSEERGSARLDWKESAKNLLSFEGDLFRNPEMQRINYGWLASTAQPDTVYGAGGYWMGRWERQGDASDTTLQTYYSDERRTEIGMKLNMQIFDLDFQHHFVAGTRNEIVWGAGFRWTSDHASGQHSYFFHNDHIVHLYSTFVQDSVTLVPSKLVFTAGTKVQWNSYTRFEVQPGASLLWTANGNETIWFSVSRAVRTPSDQDHDIDLLYPLGTANNLPLEGLIMGNPQLKSEVEIAYEGGWRRRIGHQLSLDLAAFANHYTDLEGTQVGSPYLDLSGSPAFILPFLYVNGFTANTQGAEAAVNWAPANVLHFQASYAWLQARMRSRGAASVQPSGGQDWSTPRNTLDARAFWTLQKSWTLSAALDGNSTVPSSLAVPNAVVPGHVRVDLRIARRLGESGELHAGVTNLLHQSHEEFYPEDYTMNSFVPRGFYFGLIWHR
jgi:iron complex outermembrane recepter protein